MNTHILSEQLFDIGAIKFGSFTLKSGVESPIYIDLRLTVSYPDLLESVAEAMWTMVDNLTFDVLCGVPYTALPIATAMSLKHKVPMIMRRKEVKTYGTKKAIEGAFTAGQRCLVVEDLVTSGASVLETTAPLEHEGLAVSDVVVLLDRQQGGRQCLCDAGYRLHSVLSITELLSSLQGSGRIDATTAESVTAFIESNQVTATAR